MAKVARSLWWAILRGRHGGLGSLEPMLGRSILGPILGQLWHIPTRPILVQFLAEVWHILLASYSLWPRIAPSSPPPEFRAPGAKHPFLDEFVRLFL
eukprot:scaffold23205_cov99-Isochrysis_galbana.AAC.5